MFNEKLDFPQRTAIKKALDADSIAIIQGPPGTGKTNVIIEIILQILKANKKNPDVEPKKVLLVSQSHPAVDKMLEDLIRESDERPDLLRIGRDEKLNEEIREEYSINDVKEKWYQNVRKICNDYTKNALEEIGIPEEEFDKYFLKLENSKVENMDFSVEDKLFVENFIKKTKGVKSERTRKILEIQREWTEQLKKCDEVELYIIKSTVIIAGTCTGFVSNRIIRDVEFDYVIVDEAAKATFPELAVSLNKAHKIILVGDHQQLPPVLDTEIIRNNKEKLDEEGLAQGVFERMYNMFPEDNKHRLTIQYRMHPTIGTLISHVFYNDEIQNGVEAQDRELCIEGYEGIAIEWISTSKYSTKERYEKEFDNNGKKSYQNYLERNIIERKLLELDSKLVKRTSFYHQVRDVVYSGMENFFERDWDFSKNHYDKGLVTKEDRQYTKSLIEKLNGSEIISDELVDQYIHTRALIDEKELEAIFSCNQEFDYQGIVISCERLKKLLNPEIVSALNAISKKRIWLLYDPKEYNVNKILEQNFGDKIKKKEVSVSENERISEQFICFYPNILVEYVEKTEKVFDRPITIFEGRIEFDSDVIKNKIDKIIDEYEISFSLSEPEPEKMGKNKYNKHTKKGIVHTYKKYKYKEKNK